MGTQWGDRKRTPTLRRRPQAGMIYQRMWRPAACVLVIGLAGLSAACTPKRRVLSKSDDGDGVRAGRLSSTQHAKTLGGSEVRPARRCFPEDGPASPERPLESLLDRAA